MKRLSLFIFCLLYLSNCLAQDTVERKNWLTDSVVERFYALKSNKEIKNGPYKALFQRKTPVATGYYSNNKKTGTWEFYKQDGTHVQSFNYDTNDLTFEAATDTDDDIHYLIDKKFGAGDRATRPIKIGGIYYGYIPYLTVFQLPFETVEVNTNSFRATVELLISPLGRLADYKIHIVSQLYEYDRTFNLDVNLLSEADRTFIPASYNNEYVLSRILIKCYVQRDGGLDFY